jgi:hypothetical protein
MQDVSRKEVATTKMMIRFTMNPLEKLYLQCLIRPESFGQGFRRFTPLGYFEKTSGSFQDVSQREI